MNEPNQPSLTDIINTAPVQRSLDKLFNQKPPSPIIMDGYNVSKGEMIWYKPPTRAVPETLPIAMTDGFAALITADITLDDHDTKQRFFEVQVQLSNGSYLEPFRIGAEEFEDPIWVITNLGSLGSLKPEANIRKKFIHAVQVLSKPVPIETIYTHTGFRKIADKWVYLTALGGLGDDGMDTTVRVELPGSMGEYKIPACKNNRDALLTFLDPSKIPIDIGVLLFSTVARAVLGEMSPADFSVFIVGETGSYKSEVMALAMACFGNFTSRNLPGNFSDTAVATEIYMAQGHCAVFGLDDLAPAISPQHQNQLSDKCETYFRGQGNGQGKSRGTAKISVQSGRRSRCLLMVTGEDVPKAVSSLYGRILFAELKKGAIADTQLKSLQTIAKTGALAESLGGFIQWLCPQIDTLKTEFPERITKIRDANETVSSFINAHKRSPSIYASLFAGAMLMLDYFEARYCINHNEKENYTSVIRTNLQTITKSQKRYQTQADEIETFANLIKSCLLQGDAYLSSANEQGSPPSLYDGSRYDIEKDEEGNPVSNKTGNYVSDENGEPYRDKDGNPVLEESCVAAKSSAAIDGERIAYLTGWRRDPVKKMDFVPMGKHIGYVHRAEKRGDDELWIIPNSCYQIVQQAAAAQKVSLNISRNTMGKRMHQQNLMAAWNSKEDRPAARTVFGIVGRYWVFNVKKFLTEAIEEDKIEKDNNM